MYLRIFFLVILVVSCPLLWKKTRGSSSKNLQKTLLQEKQEPPDAYALGILQQPFLYWTKGSQCDVFLSVDGKYVLKIPRKTKRKFLFPTYRKSRPLNVLQSFKIVSLNLLHETGSIYLHYAPTSMEYFPVTIKDHLGREILLNLNEYPFALQKRKTLLSTLLREKRDLEFSRKMLLCMLSLLERETKKGFVSIDFAFSLNIGTDHEEVIRIDPGAYVPLNEKMPWQQAAKPIVKWLEEYEPSLCSWFQTEVHLLQESCE